MKIILIASSVIPSKTANSMQVMKMAESFAELGHDVSLCVPEPYLFHLYLDDVKDLEKHYGVKIKFNIKYLKCSKIFKNYDFDLRAAIYARKEKADFVLSRSIPAAFFSVICGRKTFFEAHSPVNGFFGRNLFRLFCKSKNSYFIAISECLKKIYQQSWPFLKDKINVCHDGVSLSAYEQAKADFSLRNLFSFPERILFCYSGQLYKGKGAEVAVSLSKKFPEYNFLIIGGMPADIEKYKNLAELGNNIQFAGFRQNNDIPSLLKSCDFLLLPPQKKVSTSTGISNIADYMSPLKMFEYMATGVPLIASRLPVLLEVLNDRNALLCTPDSMIEWQSKIKYAADNHAELKLIAEQARMDVAEYDWKKRCEKIISLAWSEQ